MMRVRMKRCFEWIHVLLIFTIITPLIYIGVQERNLELLYRIYLSSYLLAIPVIGCMVASRKCKRFWVYLCYVLIFFFAVNIGIGIVGDTFSNKLAADIFKVCMNVATFFIAVGAYITRIYRSNKRTAKEISDASFVESIEADKPNVKTSLLFVAFYVYSLNLDCPQVCNLALFSTFVYLLFAVVYEYIRSTEEYLKLNEEACQVRNIPTRRIYGIGKAFLIVLLGLLMLTVFPAILTMNNRSYHDIRKSEPSQRGIVERDFSIEPLLEIPDFSEDRLSTYDRQSPLEKLFMDIVFYAVGIVLVVVVVVVVFRLLRMTLSRFEQASLEEEDVVERLDQSDEYEKIAVPKWIRKRSEEDRIRRSYRKFIRRHRKDRPAKYETPTEIETAAGVADTTEGKELHKQYELARYGKLIK